MPPPRSTCSSPTRKSPRWRSPTCSVRQPGSDRSPRQSEQTMEFRFLGTSGLKVSAVSYGNWVTHSQARADQATACVRAALDAGITTFDTADVYANGRAETILGDALAGERREGLEIL